MSQSSEYDPHIGDHILIICIGFLVFSPCLFNFFVSDDFIWINRGMNLAPNKILQGVEGVGYNTFRPLIPIVFFVLHRLFDLSPFGYHLCSILFHIFNVLLFYRILLHLSLKREIALVSALIFISHFAHEETMFWISSICVLSCWFLSLLSILMFLIWLRFRRISAYFLCLSSGLIAPFFREDALILVFVLCGIAWLTYSPLNHKDSWMFGVKAWLASLFDLLPLGVMSLIYFYLKSISLPHLRLGELFSFNPVNPIRNFLYFAANLIFPTRLVFDAIGSHYSRIINMSVNSIDSSTLVGIACFLVIPLAVFIFFRWMKRKSPHVRFAVLILLIPLLPSLFFKGYGLRFTYFPLLLIAPFAAYVVVTWLKKMGNRYFCLKRFGVSAALVIIILLNFFILLERHTWWKEASALCKITIKQAGRELSLLPPGYSACFVDLPARVHGAYILNAGFKDAMDLFYPSINTNISTIDGEAFHDLKPSELEDCYFFRFEEGELQPLFQKP